MAQAGSNTKITRDYIGLVKFRYSITLVHAKPRPSDLGSLGLAPFGTILGFWGPVRQALAQSAK